MTWSPIGDDNDIDFKRLTSEASAQKRELEIIGEILAVSQEKSQDLIASAEGS